LPRILFGAGRIAELPAQIAGFGHQALLVTGGDSLSHTPQWATLQAALTAQGIAWDCLRVTGEPSPAVVDAAVQQYRARQIQVVVGIGGGSVLDAAKAIAGLLRPGNSVLDHLEGVGRGLPYRGPTTPLIAVPTTAGTGSEATKNAVLGVSGIAGYKKSFRDEALVAEVALIDPDLLESCPPALIAANGMDAFTQLLESYVSSRANPLTDALAWSGMSAFQQGFFAVWNPQDPPSARSGRSQLAYAALLSGITLAQAGLGSVHGLAAPLGAFFACPHGVVCGSLLAEATDINITALQPRQPAHPALAKSAAVGRLLSGATASDEAARAELVTVLRAWTTRLALPRLRDYGMNVADLARVVAASRGNSMQTNPVLLLDEELETVLQRRL